MLIPDYRLTNTPIMGLQTGTKLASSRSPIIDPSNLKIIAYQVDGPLLNVNPSFIRIADIRELGDMGMIIDSSDEFITNDDIITLKNIYDLNFDPIGLSVFDENKHKLGKVSGYIIDTDNFYIQKLNVKRGIMKSLSESELLINRSQIIEINDNRIVVKSAALKLESINKPNEVSYMNPFRSSKPQTNAID